MNNDPGTNSKSTKISKILDESRVVPSHGIITRFQAPRQCIKSPPPPPNTPKGTESRQKKENKDDPVRPRNTKVEKNRFETNALFITTRHSSIVDMFNLCSTSAKDPGILWSCILMCVPEMRMKDPPILHAIPVVLFDAISFATACLSISRIIFTRRGGSCAMLRRRGHDFGFGVQGVWSLGFWPSVDQVSGMFFLGMMPRSQKLEMSAFR